MKTVKFSLNVLRCVWNIIASLSISIAITGCGPILEGPSSVEGILSPDSMAMILTDIHLVEGGKVGENMLGDSLRAPHFFRVVYEKYNINESSFERSFDYYTERPGEMNTIYEVVVENLSKLEQNPPRESLIEEE